MKRACGHSFLLLFILAHIALLAFATIHWQTAWPLLIWIPLLIAFLAPQCCQNYSRLPSELLSTNLDYDDFQSCREFGWVMMFFIGLCAYIPPLLTWYNTTHFPVPGVLMTFGSVVCIHCACLIWLRMYILL